MIDVRLLRSDPDQVIAAMARRHDPTIIEALERVRALDERLLDIGRQRDEIRANINTISKQIGELYRDGKRDEAEALKATSTEAGNAEKALNVEFDAVAEQLRAELLVIPNVPNSDAPDGTTDAENPVIKGPFGPTEFEPHQRVPHWETATALGILDNERATKIAKSMFTMQRGPGATLARALCQLALDLNADAYEEIRPPSLVSTATLTSTGQLPKFADDAFAVERDDLWCVPTAEVPLTALYGDEIIDQADLPKRFMAYSPSYRREAGAAGRDTRGMLRSHEFDKVELYAISTPDQAPDLLIEMRDRAEALLGALELPYRIIEICTGDMGQAHHRSYDLEVFAPGADAWLEVSSVSWVSDYQARRADIRYRPVDADGKPLKGTELVHTLNGSALAVPRVWAAIIENYRRPDGAVTIPKALVPYMRGQTVIEPV